jgi:D-alanyl-D-alanine carboxypeptidase
MTFYTVTNLISKLELDPHALIRVDSRVAEVIGTSANLRAGDLLTTVELLHGLMLPSGNDAGLMLAIHYGNLILKLKRSATGAKPLSN